MRLIDADALIESAKLFEVKACARGCGKSIMHLAKAWLFGEVRKAPTIDPEELRPKGEWVVNPDSEDGFKHHYCSRCKTDAIFHYEYADDIDEDMDGEWFVCGQIESGINESLTPACPNCGAKMGKEKGHE